MKKLIALLLAVLTVISLFSCAKKEEATADDTSATEQTEEKIYKIPEISELNYESYNLDEYIKLPDYKNFTLEYSKMTVEENDVTGYINKLALDKADKKEVAEPAKTGSAVECTYSGKTETGEGVADNISSTVVIGSNQYIPGFEDELVGLSAGDTKEFTITFPENYTKNSALGGKKVTFNVSVSKVLNITMPEIDDEFAKSTGFEGVTDMKTLKEYVKSNLEDTANYQNALYKQSALYNKLSEETEVIAYPENELKYYSKNNEEQTAKDYCKSDMITYKLKQIYQVEVTEGEFNSQLQYYFSQYGPQYNIDSLDEFYNQFGASIAHGLLQQICLQKAADDIK